MNKSKAIGTEGENYVVEQFRRVWPEANRHQTNKPGNDIINVPFPVEVRRRATWEVPAWARSLAALHGRIWALALVPRDRRLASAPPTLLVLPIEFALEVLEGWDWARWSGWSRGAPRQAAVNSDVVRAWDSTTT